MGALDAVSLGRQLDLELGAGDLGAALKTAEGLVALSPDDPRSRITAANVSIWAGRPERSLLHWTWLAARRAAPGALDQALSLAKALRDDAAIVQLLRLRGRKEPLPLAAVAELAHALESLEAPRDAIAALREYAATHARSREAWEGLAAAQERRREFADALRTRQEMGRRFGPRLSDALAIARLLWALNRPGEALDGLVRWGDAATALDVEYWEVLAEIAWQEEADATALRAYRALWASNRIDVSGAERLLLLTRATGRPEDLIALGQQSWRRMHQPRFLLLAMDEAARAGRWDELEQMAADAAASSDGLTELPAFWMLRARLDERAGRVQDAIAAYRRALAGDPGNAAARSGVIWLLAGAHEREPLSQYLAAWAKDAQENPDLSRAWLAGQEELEMARPGPAQPVAGSVGTEVGGESIGTAVLAQQRAFLRSGLAGGGEMEVSGGFAGFLSGDARLPLPGTETRVSARAVFPGLGGLTEAAAGVGLRRDSNVLSGRVARTQIFPALGEMRLEGSLHEPADESLALRAQAVRSRVGGAVAVSEGRAYQRLAGDWKSWSTRGGTALGTGGSATLEIGWRMQAPDLVVRLQGGYQRNSLRQSGLPSVVTAFAENPADILPDELASLGAGIGAARVPMGPVLLSGDVWLGWMGPPSRAAFRVQAGATVAPFKNAEVGVIAFTANDRWSAGGNVGLTLSLTHRFGL